MNKKQLIVAWLLISLFLLNGCASISNTMQSWVGSHKSALILSWGPPQQIHSDGAGGEVLVYGQYVDLGQAPGQVQSNYYGGYTYTAPQQRGYSRTRMFYVDSDGIIYNWRWKGL